MKNLNNIDETLPFIGEFGLYQIIVIAIFCLITIPGTFQSLMIYFVAANPAWKCVENSTTCNLIGTFESGDKNYTMRCNMPRSEWKFVEEYEYSIVTQFGLFCENESLIFVSHSLLFAGSAVGSLICGWLADKYGRRQLLIPCNIVVISVAFASAFSPTYWLFACSRFVVGFFGGTTLAIMFILSSELVGSRYRPTAGIVLWFFFTFALVMLGLVAMKVRKWKMLMIVSTAPYFLVIPLLFFIPESLRWMHLNRKMEQLHRDIQRIAKINGKEPLLIELSPLNEKELSVKPWMLFSTKKMAFTTLSIGFAWFINGLVYYGLSVAVDNLSNHFYRNYILSSLIELPAILIGILGATYVGRKCTVVYPMLLAGLLCALVTVIDEKETRQRFINTRVVLGLFGKFFVTLSYDTIYTWTVELFPTQIRTEALGYVLIASRIGGMFSPWISKWLRVIHWRVPFVMMGVLTIVSALLMHWLPETKEKATLEKLEDSMQQMDDSLIDKMEKSIFLIAGIVGCFCLSLLLTYITFFIGVWWKLSYNAYTLNFSLWKIVSKFSSSKEISVSLTAPKLESVIITVRTGLAISMILYVLLIVTYVASFLLKRRNMPIHLWSKARTVLFLLLLLSFVIVITHAAHCPPAYLVGQNTMSSSLSSGWNMCLVALFFVAVPANLHFFIEFRIWRSEIRKT